MGSSLVLTGGAATAKTLKESISLSSHGFTVGDVVRFNAADAKKYFKAQADSAENAEVLGIVNAITDPNTFELTYGGYIDMPKYAGLSYPVLFLDSTVSGGLTHNPPSAVGTVIKPVVTRHPTLNGYVMNNYLGTQIGGSSTVGIDEVQPVGSIMPFAGTTIPDTWLECNGTTYTVADYPELYSKLQNTSGDRAPIYGCVVTLTGTELNTGSVVVGDILQFKNNTNAWTGSVYNSNAELIGVVLSVSATSAVIQTLSVYNSTNKTLEFPNLLFKAGSVSGLQYRIVSSVGTVRSSTASITTVALTHFNTPDLRGRFALGVNQTTLADLEGDATNQSAISGIYPLGSEGGEERHILTAGEMPSHQHIIYGQDNNAQANGYSSNEVAQVQNPADGGFQRLTSETGGNDPHNNMPPYLAVRYIIKAKPYTRAAIIDSLDLPWSSTLVRDLRTRAIGGSNSDLVFYTNTAGDSGLGTERMRIEVGGEVGIGTNAPSQKLHVYDGALRVDLLSGSVSAILNGPGSNLQFKHTSGNSNLTMYNSSGGGFIFSTLQSGTEGERIRISGDGRLGIGTSNPAVALDVNGSIKTNDKIIMGSANFSVPSGSAPIFGARAWVSFDGTDLSGPGGSVKIWGASSNIDYVGRPANGVYSVYLKTGQVLPNNTGAAFASAWSANDLAGGNQMANAKVQETNRIDVTVVDVSNTLQNNNYITMVVFA